MSINLVKAGAVLVLALQPMAAGAATMAGWQMQAAHVGAVKVLVARAENGNLLLAQNQNQSQNNAENQNQTQSGNQNQNSTENQNQNQTQNSAENQNQNQSGNQNRNRNNDTEAGLATATAQAVMKASYACFYESPAFKGAKFCAETSDRATSSPAGWNDRISSIEIVGKVKVRVCTDADFSGTCKVYRSSQKALPKNLDDAISSWTVE
ncbi:Beta/Gamma crystallin [Hoeflea sp. IMCC20628]|uniref:peptidase inhibitor family I36 protein n=1 Tax=Hoeflea sp. IMCC20628 TaxID=1620421 RepID=UPI00063BD975|nr:peptidase inhibitor family I36 protein [Hoeflea sp. IMCC20628]AKI01028.1 Beta/Gamma crystallin [Hoeflea sp. IMCC20628]